MVTSRVGGGYRSQALPLMAVAAFLMSWLHFWLGSGSGTGRAWVMHDPWRFWGPQALAVAVIVLASWGAWRRPESGTWVRSMLAGMAFAVPAWLLALVPAAFVAGFIGNVWRASGARSPDEWFTAYRHSHIGMTGEGLGLMFVVAGPLALGMLVPVVSAIQAGLRRPPATLTPVVSGAATAATVLVVAAFAGFVVPARSSQERALTSPLTERRTDSLVEQHGGADLALLSAARRGSADDIEALLLSDLSPDVADSSGRTALILAADGCHLDAVMVLVRHHVSVARTDRQGLDALAHAFGTKGPGCDQTIKALSFAGGLPQRDVLCARLVEAAAGGDTARTEVLVHVARQKHMEDLLAIGYASAVRSGHPDTARRIAAYGPMAPAGSCPVTDPATEGAR